MWNYRIVKKTIKQGNETFVDYGIYEVYYDEKGKPWGVTEEPTKPQGETVMELIRDFVLMGAAATKPILDWEDIVGEEEDITLEDLMSSSNITFVSNDSTMTVKEIRKHKLEKDRMRELDEVYYHNNCVGKDFPTVIEKSIPESK